MRLIKMLDRIIIKNFNIRSDIENLKKVYKIHAIEATVFYAGRILEATSNYCALKLESQSTFSIYENIRILQDYNIIDKLNLHWAHALRRLSNQFRHILKPTEKYDGHIAIILLDKWLNWLLNHSGIFNEDNSHISLLDNAQEHVLNQFELFDYLFNESRNESIHDIDINQNSLLIKVPVFASVICEELINSSDFAKADTLLSSALSFHPHDLRLNQLKGLLLSRKGQYLKAQNHLKELLAKAPNDDETIGILAGALKKLWQQAPTKKLLHEWGKLYTSGWKSYKHNLWLGINAATYYLWSNNPQQSQLIAKKIINQFTRRESILKDKLNITRSLSVKESDYWDYATLAEAYLLAGDTKAAEKHYKILFNDNVFKNKPHKIPAE
ncbi:MAG: hypothetical protein KDC52_15135, partial [Ignavibacteriae bacterium]|nr:hypothetical protein [Ignavibacteriota bacterium]